MGIHKITRFSPEEIKELMSDYPCLTDREKKIIAMRYNSDGHAQQTLESIGNIWDLTRERIRQIIVNSIEKTRFYKKQKEEVGTSIMESK